MLPLGTSAVTIGFGFIVASTPRWTCAPPGCWSPWPTPWWPSLRGPGGGPVMRSVRTACARPPPCSGAAPPGMARGGSAPGGAGRRRRGRLRLRRVAGEFGATAFVARPGTPTLPLAIFRFLGQPGRLNFGRAMALSVILMVVTAAAVALIDRLRPAGLGDF